jgi:hypothetical protein
MESKAILDHRGDVLTQFYADEDHAGNLQLRTTVSQNIDPTLKLVKELRDNQHLDPFANKQSGWKRVAEIPVVLWDQLERQGITRDKKKLKAWLNDFHNKPFRVWEGHL